MLWSLTLPLTLSTTSNLKRSSRHFYIDQTSLFSPRYRIESEDVRGLTSSIQWIFGNYQVKLKGRWGDVGNQPVVLPLNLLCWYECMDVLFETSILPAVKHHVLCGVVNDTLNACSSHRILSLWWCIKLAKRENTWNQFLHVQDTRDISYILVHEKELLTRKRPPFILSEVKIGGRSTAFDMHNIEIRGSW